MWYEGKGINNFHCENLSINISKSRLNRLNKLNVNVMKLRRVIKINQNEENKIYILKKKKKAGDARETRGK